eukprot:6184383-Pleurochrysis_carterae.AAC.1
MTTEQKRATRTILFRAEHLYLRANISAAHRTRRRRRPSGQRCGAPWVSWGGDESSCAELCQRGRGNRTETTWLNRLETQILNRIEIATEI